MKLDGQDPGDVDQDARFGIDVWDSGTLEISLC